MCECGAGEVAGTGVCSGSGMQMHKWARAHVSMQLHKLMGQNTHVLETQVHRCMSGPEYLRRCSMQLHNWVNATNIQRHTCADQKHKYADV